MNFLLIIYKNVCITFYKLMLTEITISRILFSWLTILITLIAVMSYNDGNVHTNIGPNDSLIIFGTTINTYSKYAAVVVLCICNSAFRTINLNIIHPWIINNIQDTKIYFKVNTYYAYEITAIHAVYGFIDWYFYMNIILSQIDLFFVEMIVDLTMALLTTRHYLRIKTLSQHASYTDSVKNYILTSQIDTDTSQIDSDTIQIDI